ncbi:energy transducer TonB [Siccirubricoccus deserti]
MPPPPVLAELPPVTPAEPLPLALLPTPDALPPPPPPREAVEPPPPPPEHTAAVPEEAPPEELPLPPPPVAPAPPRPAPPRQTAARAAPPASQPAPAQAPEPAVQAGGARITGITTNASPLYRPPEPRYPEAARRRNETGTVQVRVQVDEAGRVAQVEVVTSSGSRELDRLAQSYFAQWRWRPAMRDGQPVAGQVVTAITFRLSP